VIDAVASACADVMAGEHGRLRPDGIRRVFIPCGNIVPPLRSDGGPFPRSILAPVAPEGQALGSRLIELAPFLPLDSPTGVVTALGVSIVGPLLAVANQIGRRITPVANHALRCDDDEQQFRLAKLISGVGTKLVIFHLPSLGGCSAAYAQEYADTLADMVHSRIRFVVDTYIPDLAA